MKGGRRRKEEKTKRGRRLLIISVKKFFYETGSTEKSKQIENLHKLFLEYEISILYRLSSETYLNFKKFK
jgi:hypothetical protein